MPVARPPSIVRRSSARISSAVSSSTSGLAPTESTLATAAAGLAVEIAHQPGVVGLVALDALEQRRVRRDERQIEQLGIGFLLEVDAFLLVTLMLHGALDGV